MTKTPFIEIVQNAKPAKSECFLCHNSDDDATEITLNDGGVFSVGLCPECFDSQFIGDEQFVTRLDEILDDLEQQKRWLTQVRVLASRGTLPVRTVTV